MTAAEWRVVLAFALIPAVFIIIYHYHYIYKVLTSKCQKCGKEIENQWKRKIGFIYTPWKKPRFTCESCQKEIRGTLKSSP